jgi:TnpA family transposase
MAGPTIDDRVRDEVKVRIKALGRAHDAALRSHEGAKAKGLMAEFSEAEARLAAIGARYDDRAFDVYAIRPRTLQGIEAKIRFHVSANMRRLRRLLIEARKNFDRELRDDLNAIGGRGA